MMATTAHCYYCFECLSASFDDHEPSSLTTVEDLWDQYEQTKDFAALQERDPVQQSVRCGYDTLERDGTCRFGDDDNENDDVEDDDDRIVEEDQDNYDAIGSSRPRRIKLPSIQRLQSDVTSGSSSISTTPSTLSANSSRSALSISTTVTTPISQPAASSLPDRANSRLKSVEPSPLFVTWNTISRNGNKSLRGCIGTFEAQDLSQGLKSYALTSAFDDTRFSPIPPSLLPTLSCSLTLLGSFEPCLHAMDWVLGTHGLRISFVHRSRRYSATYLPDVAVEQGWTKEETVESLMRKAGWDGTSGAVSRRLLRGSSNVGSSGSGKPWDEVSDFRAIRYQGSKASATYGEWQEWRAWVKGLEDGQDRLFSEV